MSYPYPITYFTELKLSDFANNIYNICTMSFNTQNNNSSNVKYPQLLCIYVFVIYFVHIFKMWLWKTLTNFIQTSSDIHVACHKKCYVRHKGNNILHTICTPLLILLFIFQTTFKFFIKKISLFRTWWCKLYSQIRV